MRVEVYIKPMCSLCDTATTWLLRAHTRHRFELVENDIYERQDWFDRHRYQVPVVVIDGVERLSLRFTEAELEAALAQGLAKEPVT